jgi:hypothetical protein
MSISVVDVLEVIQIHKDYAQRRVLTTGTIDLLPKSFKDDSVIPHPGQVVMFCEMAHLFARSKQFGFFPLQVLGPMQYSHFEVPLLLNQPMHTPAPCQHYP